MKTSMLIGALALALAGTTAAVTAAQAADLKFAPGEDARFNWQSFEDFKAANDLSGQEMSLFGPWLSADKDLIESVTAYFEEATGAKVNYSGSDSFEQQIVIDTQAGSAPNVAVFPQPGLAADLASKGLLVPLGSDTADWMKDNYAAGQSWVDLGTYENQDGTKAFFAFPYKADVKSLVWYVPENFEDAGYQVPQTMEELKALSEQIVADGETPWCIGLGSGGATGWPATDWVEDMMLRTQSPEVYDQWVTNEIPFNDERIVAAIEEFGAFARNDDYVDGGAGAVASTDFRDSPKGLFAVPPKCYMHRQASFIPSFFPEGTQLGRDADFFYLPAYADRDLGKPVLGAGTVFAITKESEVARAFIEFLKTPIAHEIWMAQAGFLTPHKGVNPEAYANDALRKQGEILTSATTFRFDGSDLMPGKIGAGAFWTGMIDYVGGKSAGDVAGDIQKEWDAIK
ncbi:maltose-binding protein /trehalose-binding protein /sucrose-binding protein [Nitratireductor aquibiodomus]|uniref:Maltose-binding protein /trehalose-binding protein /sucrose-binding protein n=1 Tax=Nitratireductor aquibiodomus TaxID=204799 RepID=A0A1H4JFN3_9HYPH|nr:ABC transporter substrate-binding protein [Nitratireductor aquibiodomus]SEB45124.1 maltose-binding protein /trehalose-binding protein /sucrose-binding protein [Nitratireductor aquibiodomus]